MKNEIVVLILIVVFAASCALTWSGQRLTYCDKMEGERPADVLEALRAGSLIEGMNKKEVLYVVYGRYSGKSSGDIYNIDGHEHMVKTMWSDSGTSFIVLTFVDGSLTEWSRHSI